MSRAVYIHYFKINPPLSAVLSFLEFISTLRSGSTNSKQTYYQLLIIIFLQTSISIGFNSPTRVFLEFSPKPVYSTMVAEKFQIYSVKITGNTLVSQKTESIQFYLCPQAKLSRRLLSLSPRQTGIAHLRNWSLKKYRN